MQPKVYDKKPAATVKNILDRPSVKAVIYDFDTKCNWSKLALAISCLEREDVLYLTGSIEEWIHVESVPSKIRILGKYNDIIIINIINTFFNIKMFTLLINCKFIIVIIRTFLNIKKQLLLHMLLENNNYARNFIILCTHNGIYKKYAHVHLE